MTNYPADEASRAYHDTPPMSRRDRALAAGFDPHPDDLLPPAAHLTVDGDVLAAFTAEVRNMRGECADCRTALTDPAATLCIECARDRDELAAERGREWWS